MGGHKLTQVLATRADNLKKSYQLCQMFPNMGLEKDWRWLEKHVVTENDTSVPMLGLGKQHVECPHQSWVMFANNLGLGRLGVMNSQKLVPSQTHLG